MTCMFKVIHYCQVLENFLKKRFEILACSSKKTKVKSDFSTDIDMLIMIRKGIRGGICHSIYRYGKANIKQTKESGKNKES